MLHPKKHFCLTFTDLAFLAAALAVFFTLPLLFLPDSTTYLGNAEILDGAGGIWNSVRGPVLPAVLALSAKLFGYSLNGLQMGLCALYVTAMLLVLAALHLLGFTACWGRLGNWVAGAVLLFFNPLLVAYSHVVLTEFCAFMLLTLNVVALLLLARKIAEGASPYRMEWAAAGVTAVSIVALYALKQMFFPLALITYFVYSCFCLAHKFDVKLLLSKFAVLVLALACLLGYIALYAQATGGNSVEGEAVESYAASFVLDGLRYFVPQDEVLPGASVEIQVMNDDFTEAEQRFTYTFTGTMPNSLGYLATCLAHAPGRVISGYVANFGIVAGVWHPLSFTASRAHTQVSKTPIFTNLYEGNAWIDYYKTLAENPTAYPQGEGTTLAQQQFSGLKTDSGLLSNLLFNTHYAEAGVFIYSFAAFFSPLIALLSLLGAVAARKNARWRKYWGVNLACSSACFAYLAFLAFTAQNIDRYGFPVILFCALLWVNLAAQAVYGVKQQWRRSRPATAQA